MEKKFLIFDGISQVNMGKDLEHALQTLRIANYYYDPKQTKNKPCYKLRKSLSKRFKSTKHYHYYPKLSSSKLTKLFKRERVDVVLVIGFSYPYLSPRQMKRLQKKFGFDLLLWDTDSINLLDNIKKVAFYLKQELPRYQHVFFSSKRMLGFFEKHGVTKSSFLPLASLIKNNRVTEEKSHDICFVGEPDMRRLLLLEQLTNYKLVVYGARWQPYLDIMSDKLRACVVTRNVFKKELMQLMQQSKIVLNLTKPMSQSLHTGLTARIFDVIGNKSFLLSDHCDELTGLFHLGRDIETFLTPEELLSKVSYFLENDEERQAVINNGFSRMQQQHLWQHRLQDLMSLFFGTSAEENPSVANQLQ